jgi:tetratricopeptide (TPR) repeat protein
MELFAARYDHAAELYSNLLRDDPAFAGGYYCLVRAYLGAYRAHDAYGAAEAGLRRVPETPEAQAAAGLAAWRRGEVNVAERYFKKAYKLNPNFVGSLRGLTSIYSSISKFKTALLLVLAAHRVSPDDPEIVRDWANTLHGQDHIAALERALAIYDPASREARALRAHISSDRAAGDRKLRCITSPYRAYGIKLERLMDGPNRSAGIGLRVKFNQRGTVKLMLDTGSSGIAVSPKAAEKAGLEVLSEEGVEARGIGDDKAQDSFHYLAQEVDIGDVSIADYPVSVFRSAKSANFDGLIGADVFSRFLVTLDFKRLELNLEPYSSSETPSDEPEDTPEALPPGFFRSMRFGNHLTIPTSVNEQDGRLFLIDSGSTANLIDAAVAAEYTKLHQDGRLAVRGIQGAVKNVQQASHITLAFAGFRQQNPDIVAMSLDKVSDGMGVGIAGILGMPVLSQMKLTINYRSGAVRFERKP